MGLINAVRLLIFGTIKILYDVVRAFGFFLACINLILILLDIIPIKIGMTVAAFIIAACTDILIEYRMSKKVTKDFTDEEIKELVKNCYEHEMVYWLNYFHPNKIFNKVHIEFLTFIFRQARNNKQNEPSGKV